MFCLFFLVFRKYVTVAYCVLNCCLLLSSIIYYRHHHHHCYYFAQYAINSFVFSTKMVKCASDTEFFAKLHCIRLAFTVTSTRDVWFLLFNTMLCKVQTWLSSLGDGLLQCQVTAFISGWEIQLLVISRRPSDQNCTRKSPPLTVGNCEPSNGVVRALFYDVVLSITDNIQAWWCAY